MQLPQLLMGTNRIILTYEMSSAHAMGSSLSHSLMRRPDSGTVFDGDLVRPFALGAAR
jgi:hypothetical protein